MRDKTNENVIKIGIIAFIVIILGIFGIRACDKEEVPVETSGPVMQTSESHETETSPSSGEIIEVEPSETEPEEDSEIDDIIEQLISDANQEEVETPTGEAVTEDNPLKEPDEDREFDKTIRESLGIPEEDMQDLEEAVGVIQESVYDSDNDERTREIEGFDYVSETEPIVEEDGTVLRTPEYKMQEAYEHTEYIGAKIEKNNSSTMRIGKIYHYFNDDGSKYGEVGDIVMCGQLGVDVDPGAARDGYYLNTYGNTVEIDTAIGMVKITKLKTDELDVVKMSDNQIRKLAQDNSLTYRFMNATGGSDAAYSTVLFDKSYTNGVQYYQCAYGTYEIKYYGRYGGVGLNLTAVVVPDSTTN